MAAACICIPWLWPYEDSAAIVSQGAEEETEGVLEMEESDMTWLVTEKGMLESRFVGRRDTIAC